MLNLLDTDMVIFMLRGLKARTRQRARRDQAMALVARCRDAQAKGDVVGLSAITVSELEFGACNSGHYETEIVAVRKILTPFEVFDYDGTTCPAHYGRIRHELEQAGQAIGAMDLLIAAHVDCRTRARPFRDTRHKQPCPFSAGIRAGGDVLAVIPSFRNFSISTCS